MITLTFAAQIREHCHHREYSLEALNLKDTDACIFHTLYCGLQSFGEVTRYETDATTPD